MAEGGFIKILNYGGVKMGEIAFSESDGVPEHLDINAEFLAVVTSKGRCDFILIFVVVPIRLFLSLISFHISHIFELFHRSFFTVSIHFIIIDHNNN